MRCETTTIWIQVCGERKAFQTAAFCGRSLHFQSSKGISLCVIEVVPTVGYGSRHEIFAGRLLWHVLGETKVLLSYLVCSVANAAIALGFTAMYTTTRKKLWEATWKSEFMNKLRQHL